MEVNLEVTRKIIISLNDEEAGWLLEMVRNPHNCTDSSDEHPQDRSMRKKLYDALNEIV